ncbi:MAG: hypothetical protein ACXQTQ_00925 [Candidatus Hecatellaceae archaeon]|nr:MAG: hypothetical protein DRO43_04425 [Candidatus Hecatellales archaeon]
MGSARKGDKKFIAVRGDLLRKAIEISNRRGKSFYGFVNEVFEQAIRAEEMDSTLAEIVEKYKFIETLRKAGAVMVTLDLLNYCLDQLLETRSKDLLERWYESGVWYGKYLSAKFENPLEALSKTLNMYFWEISEIRFSSNSDGTATIKIIAPNQSHEHTELLAKFVEGVVNSLNYKISKREFWKGIIILELVKRMLPPDMESGFPSL